MSVPKYHTIRVSHALYEECDHSGHIIEGLAWETVRRRANGAADEPEPTLSPFPSPSGTLIVANRRTRCPHPDCRQPVERDSDAVMMDATEYGWGPREAFHVACAQARGWGRA